MTGSMYAGIAGLKTHMSKLNVIGNNVANANTYGYKAQRAVFTDAMYTTSSSGSNGTNYAAGRNPAQIGYGSSVRTIDLDMSTGTFAATGFGLDCMIDGDGFFLTSSDKHLTFDNTNPDSLKAFDLSRLGALGFDAQGYLVDGAGNCVYGFACIGYTDATETEDAKPIYSNVLTPLRLPMAAPADVTITLTADAGGGQKTIKAGEALYPQEMVKDPTNGNSIPAISQATTTYQAGNIVTVEDQGYAGTLWDITLDATTGAVASNASNGAGAASSAQNAGYDFTAGAVGAAVPTERCSYSSLSIDGTTGKISGINKDTQQLETIGCLAIASVDNPAGVSHTSGAYYRALDGAGKVRVASFGGATEGNIGVPKDMQVKNKTATGAAATPTYGQEVAPDTTNANAPTLSQSARILNSGKTSLATGGLELSKTDLATEISEMITTQRGYQANTRIITVTDAMLEELVNMKR